MCNCIKQTNEQLEQQAPGMRLSTLVYFNGKPPRISIDTHYTGPSRGRGYPKPKEPFIEPHYCPMCGERYEEQEKAGGV